MKSIIQTDVKQIELEMKVETFVAQCVLLLVHVRYCAGSTFMSDCGCVFYHVKTSKALAGSFLVLVSSKSSSLSCSLQLQETKMVVHN